jgi:beta-mannosidase
MVFSLAAQGDSLEKDPVAAQKRSLDEIEREEFKAGPSPLEGQFETVQFEKGAVAMPDGAPVIDLDGEWQMAEGGEEDERLKKPWKDAVPAMVPGSVHTALEKAGIIPDPKFGKNDVFAREKSFKTWWFKRTFKAPEDLKNPVLRFGGVAIRCTVWLNNSKLGEHEGMFGGPDFNVAGLLKEQNTLIVKIEPAPLVISTGQPGKFFEGMNVGWIYTVVFNNVYGWHYSDIPALGIWRSVILEGAPAVSLQDPFIATRDAHEGIIDFVVALDGGGKPIEGKLTGVLEPDNFEGETYRFEHKVSFTGNTATSKLRMKIPDPKLWWPNGVGDPNLYKMKLSFQPNCGGIPDLWQSTFGLRTIRMDPFPQGPQPDLYNWTFVVNGRPMFVKGTGWCTMDSSMDFSRERYKRLMVLARDQHIQMFRAWGAGMPETDDFYDFCNRYGIMVMQEWPTAWNSHNWQPYHILEDTVRRNTLRLRNHPSLVMWGGGNESWKPYGPAIDMMGRYSIELDGTRPFHRSEARGGSTHNYFLYWGNRPLDVGLGLTSPFFGEFGVSSMPVYESVQRYLPDDEKDLWPAPEEGSLFYHTPVFNKKDCMARHKRLAGYLSECRTMEDFIRASQVAAATGVRHTLELARTRWPECTGALYYKMNDNYPAASWACVDWYGAPKMEHYFFQQAFAPLHACLLFSAFDMGMSEGRFGNGLDLTKGKKEVEVPGGMSGRPLTFSLWAKIKNNDAFNILMAVAPKNAKHWEVYTRNDTGLLAVHMPEFGSFISEAKLEDDKWHYVAFRLLERGFELYLDGRKILDKQIGKPLIFDDRPLILGGIEDNPLRWNGAVDDVVVSTGLHELEGFVPSGPAERGADTRVVLTFDDEESNPAPKLPVYLLDDVDALKDASWEVRVQAFDSELKRVQSQTFEGRGAIDRVKKLGEFTPDRAALSSNPLLFVVEVLRDGEQAHRTFYWTKFEAEKDSLFKLPKTQCSFKAVGDSVVITNDGDVPAVAVSIERTGHADTFHASENFVWLEPGESKKIKVNTTEGLKLEGWNL